MAEAAGDVSVSGDKLVPCFHQVKLSGSEWRIVVTVPISSRPVSARYLASRPPPGKTQPACL